MPTQYITIPLLALLIFLTYSVSAQNGSLFGTVTHASTQSPIADANISLKGINLGSITSPDGKFQLEQVQVGIYRLVISHVNYKPWYQTISIEPSQSVKLHPKLTESARTLTDVVVTATRAKRSVDEVPMPTQVITEEQIDQIGSLRLNEVLQEQTGLQMIYDHGSGLQMQGLSSDYILILIDGEPVIGRNAGTIDLARLTVTNIARIEIIRGSTSSLYGSEAMAGVVYIITKGAELAIPIGSGNGWNYTSNSNPPMSILPIQGRIIVLKTEQGYYAKMEILSYYEESPDTSTEAFANFQTRPADRHYTFRYAVQPDDS